MMDVDESDGENKSSRPSYLDLANNSGSTPIVSRKPRFQFSGKCHMQMLAFRMNEIIIGLLIFLCIFSIFQWLRIRTNWTIWIMKLWTLQFTIQWHRAMVEWLASSMATIACRISLVCRAKRFWLLVAPKMTCVQMAAVFIIKILYINPLTYNFPPAWNATTLTNLQRQTVSDSEIPITFIHFTNGSSSTQ